jgi:hypothetical protein
VTATSPVRTLWSHTNAAPWRGLALARERGWALAWDAGHTLLLFNRRGEPQAQWPCPAELIGAAAADDGGTFAAAGADGRVWLLAPDLTVRWERRVGSRAAGVALEAFGRYLAASDAGGTLHLLDRDGRAVWQASNPRPLQHLAFLTEQPRLVGSADYGLVACYDSTGRCVWRDGLVANVGSLAARGDGSLVVLTCFSEGICCYRNGDPRTRRFLPHTAPAHRAAMSYDGKTILTTDRESTLAWHDADGPLRRKTPVDARPVALALAPLGDGAVVAFADGRLSALTPEPN